MVRLRRIDHHRSIEYVEEEAKLPPGSAFAVTPDPARRAVTASGSCPACGGLTSAEFPYGIGGTGTKGGRPGAAPQPASPGAQSGGPSPSAAITRATICCECGHAHPGRPAGASDVGCGRFWQVDLAPEQP